MSQFFLSPPLKLPCCSFGSNPAALLCVLTPTKMTLLQFLVVPRNISDGETPIVAVRMLGGKGRVAKTNSKVTWVTRKTPAKKNSVFLAQACCGATSFYPAAAHS
jgi:hypothetical protein